MRKMIQRLFILIAVPLGMALAPPALAADEEMVSGIKMSLDELHYAFALSVERINPDEGYVEGNIALVCREFNI